MTVRAASYLGIRIGGGDHLPRPVRIDQSGTTQDEILCVLVSMFHVRVQDAISQSGSRVGMGSIDQQ